MAAILKIEELRYLSNSFTDRHNFGNLPYQQAKFRIFEIQNGGRPPS